ncbi:hypothetical protein M405DRAFT_141207 [Rhizopogon salebrosus TDB-379]|nr:hypothetical protein M405DRAFT_141207 [Rhizopogon salebrosus TDB-379]
MSPYTNWFVMNARCSRDLGIAYEMKMQLREQFGLPVSMIRSGFGSSVVQGHSSRIFVTASYMQRAFGHGHELTLPPQRKNLFSPLKQCHSNHLQAHAAFSIPMLLPLILRDPPRWPHIHPHVMLPPLLFQFLLIFLHCPRLTLNLFPRVEGYCAPCAAYTRDQVE